MTQTTCNRCGLPIDLEDLHPDSLPVPEDTDPDNWCAVHGDGDQCGEDRRTWVVEEN